MYGVIYCLTNKINGKHYFGQTIQKVEKYLESHKWDAKNGSNRYIHRAIRKYGWDNFLKKIICECGDVLSLSLMEDLCIVNFNTLAPNGYNLKRGGYHGKFSEELKEKLSGENHHFYGKHHPESWKKEQSERMFGENNPMFGVHRYGKDAPMFNKKHPEKWREEQSRWMSGENNPNYGKRGKDTSMYEKHHTEKSRQAISEKALKRAKIKEKCPYCEKEFSACGIGRHKKACKENLSK